MQGTAPWVKVPASVTRVVNAWNESSCATGLFSGMSIVTASFCQLDNLGKEDLRVETLPPQIDL